MAATNRLKSSTAAKKPVKEKKPSRLLAAVRVALFSVAAAYTAWILAAPESSGLIGKAIGEAVWGAFGWTSWALPLVFGWSAFLLARGLFKGPVIFTLGSAVALAALSIVFSHLGSWVGNPAVGGGVGLVLSTALSKLLGSVGSFLTGAAVFMIAVQGVFEVSWPTLFKTVFEIARDDYKEWMEARKAVAAFAGASATEAPTAPAAKPAKAPKPEVAKPLAPFPNPSSLIPNPSEPARPAQKTEKTKPVPQTKPIPVREDAKSNWKLPTTEILEQPEQGVRLSDEECQANMALLETTFANFGISVKASGYSPGPVITQYELQPAPGVKVSSIIARANDLALALRARSVRIVAPIPGKAAVGIEIPNPKPAKVVLREVLESPSFQGLKGPLPFTLGRTVDGTASSAEISGMPHLLVAGATNSGKSVMMHSLILSILYRSRPDQVKLLLIDPKRLELSFYEGLPHLYDPRVPAVEVGVLTQPKDAAKSLAALVEVMSDRYEKYKTWGVRNIEGYNEKAASQGMPQDYYIIVVIDELADLILVAQKSVEDSIQRLAQMARAVGIHLVLATQRPSTDVITGVIKANLPARIALSVMSQIDSRVILDGPGAETLLGRGDMLYLAAGSPEPVRMQSPYVSVEEINKVVDFWRQQGKPAYQVLVKSGPDDAEGTRGGGKDLAAALKLVLERKRVSQDLLKAHFGSSARATDLLSQLEIQNFIHKPEGSNRWEIYFDKIEDYLRRNAAPAGEPPAA